MAISIQLIIVLFILFLYNFYYINANKWINVFYCLFFLLLTIPVEVQRIISGSLYSTSGILNISVVGYDIIIIVICTIILKKKIRKFTKKNLIYILLGLISILGMRLIIDGASAPSNKMFDNYCLPILLSILIIKSATP